MNTIWYKLYKPFTQDLAVSPYGEPMSVQGLFYIPDPMLSAQEASVSPFFPVNSTLTLDSRVPVWTLRDKDLVWRQSDLLRGTFVGSTAFQMWIDWAAATYDLHRFDSHPQDVDFNWHPLWIPEEYPLGRFPLRQSVPVIVSDQVQPLVSHLAQLWASRWWNCRNHKERVNNALNDAGLIQLEKGRCGFASVSYLEERFSASRTNLAIGQTGRYKLSYYGYTGTERVDVTEIQFCPMDTLNTATQRLPGSKPSVSEWIELVYPNGRHLPVEPVSKLLMNWYMQMSRVMTNRLNPVASFNEQFDDNEKLGRKQQKIKLLMRWRREILNNVKEPWVNEIMNDESFVKMLQKIAGQPLLSTRPEDLERVSSSWFQEWFSI
jgi:hypothetical protein